LLLGLINSIRIVVVVVEMIMVITVISTATEIALVFIIVTVAVQKPIVIVAIKLIKITHHFSSCLMVSEYLVCCFLLTAFGLNANH